MQYENRNGQRGVAFIELPSQFQVKRKLFERLIKSVVDADEVMGTCSIKTNLNSKKSKDLKKEKGVGERYCSKIRLIPKSDLQKLLHSRKLTVPKGLHLFTKEKYGERYCSCYTPKST